MSTKNTIPYDKSINNFFLVLKLTLYLTIPQRKHLSEFIFAAVGRGCKGKVSHISENCFNTTHRTSIGRFLSESTWNKDYVLRAMQNFAIKRIWDLSRTTGEPIYVIIDDTISEKTIPSSRAKSPMELCGFHQSHTKNKTVYGHQIVGVLLQCGDITIPYELPLYDKKQYDSKGNKISKIMIAIKTISSLPKPPRQGYVLADSWYSAEKIIKASLKNGFQYVGALKTNRVIYPKDCRLSQKINGYAQMIDKDQFHLVTVNGHSYYIFRYQGKINGFKSVTILISYPKNAFHNTNALKAFITTDVNLSDNELLQRYKCRWTIETFFRQNKMELNLDKYQIRSSKSIKRYLIIIQLAYLYCTFGVCDNYTTFGEGIRIARNNSKKSLISWIYDKSQDGLSKQEILKLLKVA